MGLTMSISNNGFLALLVALPGELRDGLESLLHASAGISVVVTADDFRSALEEVQSECPELVVVELAVGDAIQPSDLAELKTKCPGSKYLALAENAAQAAEAESVGADIAVLKGYRAAELSDMVSKMLEGNTKTD
jgi:DNA-binding NarL/FixJ family response regulator